MARKILDRKERQIYLQELGLYKGPINGKWTSETKAAVYKLQKKYFPKKYQDGGKYTRTTDYLLVNAVRVKRYAPHFSLEEFKCGCDGKYCSGYSAYLDIQLLKDLEKTRTHFNIPISIACGLRCEKYNSTLPGSIKRSGHVLGCAADIYNASFTNKVVNRRKVMSYWRSLPDYYYTYAYDSSSTDYRMKHATYMGSSVHVETRLGD